MTLIDVLALDVDVEVHQRAPSRLWAWLTSHAQAVSDAKWAALERYVDTPQFDSVILVVIMLSVATLFFQGSLDYELDISDWWV